MLSRNHNPNYGNDLGLQVGHYLHHEDGRCVDDAFSRLSPLDQSLCGSCQIAENLAARSIGLGIGAKLVPRKIFALIGSSGQLASARSRAAARQHPATRKLFISRPRREADPREE
jgi:hypothetical protein